MNKYITEIIPDLDKLFEAKLEAAEELNDDQAHRLGKVETKLKSVDEFLGELIGEGQNEIADRLCRALRGQR